MKIKDIIDDLINHKISKVEAVEQLTKIVDDLRKNGDLEFIVTEIRFSIEDNHGYLKLKLPYGYSKIEGKVKKGDKVDITILP